MDRRRILLIGAVVVAALAAVLVFVYANRASDDATASGGGSGATVPVLVATQDIDAGESANKAYAEGKIAVQNVPASSVLPGAGQDGAPYKGLFAATKIYAGEQLLTSKFSSSSSGVAAANEFLAPLKGDSAIAINLADLNHVGPYVQPGSRVAIMIIPANQQSATQDGEIKVFPARVLVPNVKVIGLCTTVCTTTAQTPASVAAAVAAPANGTGTTTGSGDLPVVSTSQIILSVNQDQNEIIGGAVYAKTPANLYFALLNADSKIQQDVPVPGRNLRSPSDSQEN